MKRHGKTRHGIDSVNRWCCLAALVVLVACATLLPAALRWIAVAFGVSGVLMVGGYRVRRAWRREAQRQTEIIEQFNQDYPPGG